jgi:hypothetical protein
MGSVEYQICVAEMSLIKEHFLAVLICSTITVCFVIHACANRYVNAGVGHVLDKWTGEVTRR